MLEEPDARSGRSPRRQWNRLLHSAAKAVAAHRPDTPRVHSRASLPRGHGHETQSGTSPVTDTTATAHTVQVRTLYLHCSGRTAAVAVPLVRARGPYLRAPSTRGTGASLYLYLRYALECSFDMLIAIFCEPSHTLHALDENPST